MRTTRFILISLALLASAGATAVEILDAVVTKKDGRYHVHGVSRIDASPEFIFATLMDFDNFHKISGGIGETRFVPSDVPGELLGYTRIEACVLFFCRKAEKVERIEGVPNTEIRTEIIPERSDFRFYESRWTIEPTDDGTIVTHDAEFEPDFWMPPLISTWAIKRKLVKSAEGIGLNLEYLQANGLTLAMIREEPAKE
ncbi:MAG: SRPBCC family protein [Gammaproteobacteria bacterium]